MPIPDSAPRRSPAAMTLTVTTTRERTVVTASGELGNATAGRLRECLRTEIVLRPRALVVDLSRAGSCSAGFIRALADAHGHARAEGVPCVVVSAHPAVVRPLTALGLTHVVDLHPDLAAAEGFLAVAVPPAERPPVRARPATHR